MELTRRELLRAAAAAGIAFSFPSILFIDPATAQNEKLSFNEFMIKRISQKPVPDPFEFVFCADTHIPFDDRRTVKTIANKANELGAKFVIIGGDSVQVGDPRNFKSFFSAMKKFDMPIVCAIGNHDTSFSDYSDNNEWKKRFGKTFFFFDAGPARMIFLDNANHILPDDEYNFLEKALDTNLKKFIFMHRPPGYLNSKYITPMKDPDNRFAPMIEKGGVTAVMTGHEHHHGHYEKNGIHYIVSGGGGGKLNTYTDNNYHHIIHVRVGSNEFNFKVIKI
ncbi:MAG TPA: metallophosphoesterase [bacterium]|mgnify:CR=1 FL=1|nr:metallophosphoesterase [bacterium]